MRIVCPHCHALYEVPGDLLGNAGRLLRCGQCGHGWRFLPEGQAEEAMPDATPEPPPEQDAQFPAPEMDEPLNRRFGQPLDDEAKAEVQAALRDEAISHPHPEDMIPSPGPAGVTEADRFADLVRAARNNEMELEPERVRQRPPVKQKRLVVPLLILLILAVIVLERHALMRAIPASAKLFHALHLS
ncbi:MAG: zinc-ribbon domain-containing protein [Rhodospirillales bacterium]|nr:zinc-ribbon domain-containing protein [Rhodospirillales bacterium]